MANLQDVIERMKAEGDLTRNSGTNSLKQTNRILGEVRTELVEIGKSLGAIRTVGGLGGGQTIQVVGGAGGGGWDRYNTKGERIGKCGDSKPGEGKPKCLSKSRAASLRAKGGKAAIGAAVRKKRRNDPNKNRKGKAKNVSNTTRKSKKKK